MYTQFWTKIDFYTKSVGYQEANATISGDAVLSLQHICSYNSLHLSCFYLCVTHFIIPLIYT
jgi:hypothetical protein